MDVDMLLKIKGNVIFFDLVSQLFSNIIYVVDNTQFGMFVESTFNKDLRSSSENILTHNDYLSVTNCRLAVS